MKILNIIAFVLSMLVVDAHAQTESSDQSRKIEISNENGELSISFKNGVITNFVINDRPVSKDKYDQFEDILDDFANEDVYIASPNATEPPIDDDQQSAFLQENILELLSDQINEKKYNIELRRKYLKVNGTLMNDQIHAKCLDFFAGIYGHKLNVDSHAKFKKSGKSSTSSVKITDTK